MREEDDEVIVGRHESGVMLEEGLNTNTSKYYCSNCKNNIHCHVKVDDGTAQILMTCKNEECQCKCRTHFACKKCGHLHPYGMQCNYKEETRKIDPQTEDEVAKILEQWKNKDE